MLSKRFFSFFFLFLISLTSFCLGMYFREISHHYISQADTHSPSTFNIVQSQKYKKTFSKIKKQPDFKEFIKGYSLQIASYQDERDAVYHSLSLKSQGYTAFYQKAHVKGKSWYRVLLGNFQKLGTAKKFKTKLINQNKIKEALVLKL